MSRTARSPQPVRRSVQRSVRRPGRQPGGGRVLRLLTAALVALLSVAIGVPAQAAVAATDPTAGPQFGAGKLPVQVVLTAISPDAVGPTAQVTLTATLTNTGLAEVSDLLVRLQRDRRQTTRSAMAATDANPPAYASKVTTWQSVDGSLAPGASMSVTITRTAAQLGLVDTGVYPVLLNVNGSVKGDASRVGQSALYLPYFETDPKADPTRVGVSWLWPLVDRPHRGVDERYFLDDQLAASIRPGGRLATMLRLAEKYAVSAQMTLLVDPDLVAELEAMSDGYEVSGPASTGSAPSIPANTIAGTGTQDAADFLTRLRVLARDVPVAALPYADVDTVALTRAGLGQQVVDARRYGKTLVQTALGVEVAGDLDWPAGGLLTDAARGFDEQAGVTEVVLSGAAFGQPQQLSSADGVTESPATTLPGGVGLAVDPTLSRIVAEGASYAGGSVSARQRFGAELAEILGEAPSRTRSVLLVPPRYWDPPVDFAEALLQTPSTLGWTQATGLPALAAEAPVDRGALVYPKEDSVQEIPGAALAPLQRALSDMDDLRTAMAAKDANTLLNPYQRAVWRAASNAGRGSPELVTQRGNQILTSLTLVRRSVTLITPPNGTYTLASSSAPLVFTVQNNLDVTVNVQVVIRRGTAGLTAMDPEVHPVQPNSRTTITVPAEVERSGSFTILTGISTPGGQPLGTSVQIAVRSTAYGSVALIVTGAAFALLLALFARRGVRRLRARHHPAPPPPIDPDDRADTAVFEAVR